MIKYQRNDGGRLASKRPLQCSDCFVRAVAIACDKNYDAAYDHMREAGRASGKGTPWSVCRGLLGPIAKQHLKWPNGITPDAFQAAHPTGRFVVFVPSHAYAIVDGVTHDMGLSEKLITEAYECDPSKLRLHRDYE